MRLRRLVAIAFLSFLGGCLTPTEIFVTLTSQDLVCAGGATSDLVFRSADIVAATGESGTLTAAASASTMDCKPGANGSKSGVGFGSIVLVPQGAPGEAELIVAAGIAIGNGPTASGSDCLDEYRAFRATGGPSTHCDPTDCKPCVVATRSVGFVKHEKLELDVELNARCRGVFCQAGQTCGADGQCVSNKATCDNGKCQFPGEGGAGGSAATVSVSSASSSESSSSAGGAGGASSGLAPVLDPAAQPIGKVNDLWSNADDDIVWAATDTGLFQCQPTVCTAVVMTLPPPILHVTGAGTNIYAATGHAMQSGTTMGAWTNLPLPATCNIDDLHGTVAAGPSSAITDPMTGALKIAPMAFAQPCVGPNAPFQGPGSLWVFEPATTVSGWLANSTSIFSFAAGSSAVFPTAALSPLWGFDRGTVPYVLACDTLGSELVVASFPAGQPNPNVLMLPEPCTSLWGIRRGATSDADVWVGTQHGAIGLHIVDGTTLGVTPPNTDLDQGLPPNETSRVVSVGKLSVWVGSQSGLYRGTRPTIP